MTQSKWLYQLDIKDTEKLIDFTPIGLKTKNALKLKQEQELIF